MPIERKYGDRLKVEGIPADEPVFLFRAQDILATDALVTYRDRLISKGLKAQADDVDTSIDAFVSWGGKHPDAVKLPD